MITLIPAFTFYSIFTLWPNLLSVYYSLLEWNGVTEAKFVGLKNFVKMCSDRYVQKGLLNSLEILVITVPLTILIGLILAFALTNTKFRENKFYQALFYFPNIMPVVVVALLWSFIYDGDMGMLNGVLGFFTSRFDGNFWLADKSTALICIMIPMIWCNVGYHMVIYINAMMAVPESLYEFAIMEGATMLQKMRYVTLPLIRETLVTSATFLILNAFNSFELILLTTGGGPNGSTNTLSMYMYNVAFGKQTGIPTRMYGYASAIGMLLMVIMMIIRGIMGQFTKAESVQY